MMDAYGEGDVGSQPYNELPLLPPGVEIETKKTLKRAIAANKALSELRFAGNLVPNQGILIRAMVLQEARLSSEIENIVTTNDELYRAFSADEPTSDANTKEVLRYEEALWHGYNHIQENRPLSPSLFTNIARIIKFGDLDVRKLPGTKIVNASTGRTAYMPPEGEDLIRALIQNLCEYLNSEDHVDPLIKMAVAHYQFESIHPYPDGNGRIGRVINLLYLVERKLLDVPVLYLSRFITENKAAYYHGLQAVTAEGAWEDWIVYMLDAIEQTAGQTLSKLRSIQELVSSTIDEARSGMKTGYSRELIDLIFEQPYTRIDFLDRAGIAKRDSASKYLRELERLGVLESSKRGREVLYLNRRLLDLLTR